MLAEEAVHHAQTPQAVDALRRALAVPLGRVAFRAQPGSGLLGLTPDGRYAASYRLKGAIRVWDVKTGKLVGSVHPPGGASIVSKQSRSNDLNLALSPDDRHLAIVGPGTNLDIADWRRRRIDATSTLAAPQGARVAAFSPDGNLVIVGGPRDTARIWSWRSGNQAVSTFPLEPPGSLVSKPTVFGPAESTLLSAAFTSDARYVAINSPSRPIRVWNRSERRIVASLPVPDVAVALEFSPGDRYLLTGGPGNAAGVWDWKHARLLTTLRGHVSYVTAASFSRDGKYVITASTDGTARIWDWQAGSTVLAMRGQQGPIYAARMTADENHVVTVSADGTVRAWPTLGASRLARIGGTSTGDDPVQAAGFTADGRFIVAARRRGQIRVWDWGTHSPLRSVTMRLPRQEDAERGVEVSPDGKYMALIGDDGVRILDWQHSSILSTLRTQGSVSTASFSPDGRHLAVGLAKTTLHFHAKGMSGSTGPANTLEVWDWRTHRTLGYLPPCNIHRCASYGAPVESAKFSPDGADVVVGIGNGESRVWNWREGRQEKSLDEFSGSPVNVAFRPDGRALITAQDNTARIWDPSTGSTSAILVGHTKRLTSAAFSPDGTLAITASLDGTVRIWDADFGQELETLNGFVSPHDAAFSPDGRSLLVVSADQSAQIYSCDVCGSVAEMLHRAQARVTRSLTTEERKRYLP